MELASRAFFARILSRLRQPRVYTGRVRKDGRRVKQSRLMRELRARAEYIPGAPENKDAFIAAKLGTAADNKQKSDKAWAQLYGWGADTKPMTLAQFSRDEKVPAYYFAHMVSGQTKVSHEFFNKWTTRPEIAMSERERAWWRVRLLAQYALDDGERADLEAVAAILAPPPPRDPAPGTVGLLVD